MRIVNLPAAFFCIVLFAFIIASVGLSFMNSKWAKGVAGINPDMNQKYLASLKDAQRDDLLKRFRESGAAEGEFKSIYELYYDRTAIEQIQKFAAPQYYTALAIFCTIVVPITCAFCSLVCYHCVKTCIEYS